MLIGKAGSGTTAISTADAASVTVRGRDLCSDLMGRLSFTDYFHLLVTGREPTETQRFFLDLLLVAIAEHGLVPTNQAARMTYAADPGVLQAAVAAGILGCGSVVLGTAEACGRFLAEARGRTAAARACAAILAGMRAAGRSCRASAIRCTSRSTRGAAHPRARRGARRRRARTWRSPARSRRRSPEVWGKPLPMNVSMPIAAVLLDLDFPPAILKGIPILARTASLLAHLAEESANPIGFLMAAAAEEAIAYRPDEDG